MRASPASFSRRLRIRLAPALLLLAPLLLPAPGPAAAATSIALEARASKLAAYGGYVAWSHFDSVAGVFRLSVLFRGKTQLLPVAAQPLPFDVSLGPDARGQTVAVYSRCGAGSLAVWVPGMPGATLRPPRGCRIYEYSFRSRSEHRLPGVRSTGSVYLPSIWRNELAYVHVVAGTPQVVEQGLSPVTITVRNPGRPPLRRRLPILLRVLPEGDGPLPGPVSVSLRGFSVAVAWLVQAGDGALSSAVTLDTLPGSVGPEATNAVTLDSFTGGPGAPGFLLAPTVVSSGVAYGLFDGSSILPSADAVRRAAFTGDPLSETPAPHSLRAVSFDGSLQATLSGPYQGDFSLCGTPGCVLTITRG